MTYTAARDAILVHATAAAAAVDPTWTDVAIGIPLPLGRMVRVFYGGEKKPVRMGASLTVNSQMVAETVVLAAFWPLPESSISGFKAVDDEMYAFKHELRTRILGDAQLGGMQQDLEMDYAKPDLVVVRNARYGLLEVEFTTDYTEYAIAP